MHKKENAKHEIDSKSRNYIIYFPFYFPSFYVILILSSNTIVIEWRNQFKMESD